MRRFCPAAAAAVAVMALAMTPHASPPPRERINFDFGWRTFLGEPGTGPQHVRRVPCGPVPQRRAPPPLCALAWTRRRGVALVWG